MREHEWSLRLMLNGDAIRLGTVSDVVDKIFGRFSIEIGVSDDVCAYDWRFEGDRLDMSMEVSSVSENGVTVDNPALLRYLLSPNPGVSANSLAHRLVALTYLSAERVGPREVYTLADPQIAPVVGPAGEHTASVLHLGRDKDVLDELVLTGVPSTRLRQVDARMRTFFPGCSVSVDRVPQTNFVTLGLRTSEETDYHRPINVGFGITQVLPIVVAVLSASRNDILLIENPEVHLHPAGQAQIGQFLADAAMAGVQVIIETHSDHVLNGIRRAVKSGSLAPDQVAIHFFRSRSQDSAQVISPQIDRTGNIDVWPDGFFDQFDKDTSYFAGWGD